jgi:PPIC-type PPIASE domain
VKRLLALLIVLAGGVAAASFLVPSNAATVSGTSVSQADLHSDVSAIAASPYYQCYLNSEAYISSQGTQELPQVVGAGTGLDAGDHPTATAGFTSYYLSQEVNQALVGQVADRHDVTVTSADLKTARAALTNQISSVMTEILQTQQGQDVRYGCSLTGTAITGTQVLATMPVSFVDTQVEFVATITVLEEDLSGVGASDADLQSYFTAHQSQFDTVCLTAAGFSSESAAADAAAQVAFGTPFATVAAANSGGAQGCRLLPEFAAELPSDAGLADLSTGAVSAPITLSTTEYALVQITKRTPSTFSAAKAAVQSAVEAKGSAATQKALTAAERHTPVSVNPQYGVWSSVNATVLSPLTPNPSDVLNAAANESRSAPASVSGLGSSASGAGAGASGASGEGAGTGTATGTTGSTGAGAATGTTGSTGAGGTTGTTGTGATSSTSTTG